MLTRYYDGFRFPTLDVFDTLGLLSDASVRSRTDTIDEEGIKVEMPGVKPDDLEVTIDGRTLKVAGKSRHGKEFTHTYTLRSAVDEANITAQLRDGLLEIRLPKKSESKARKISVT